jgi:hypothetical protein
VFGVVITIPPSMAVMHVAPLLLIVASVILRVTAVLSEFLVAATVSIVTAMTLVGPVLLMKLQVVVTMMEAGSTIIMAENEVEREWVLVAALALATASPGCSTLGEAA